jgi:hypothetical protein
LSNDPDEGRISIFLVGEGTGPLLNINRDMLDFGSVAVFSDSVLNLTINNLGNDSLILRDFIITGQPPDSIVYEIADSTLQLPYALEPDNSVILPVRFSPIRSGLATAQLVIQSNDPFRDEAAVQLTGKGIAPVIVVSDTILNFGHVSLSSESQLDITITNLGNNTLVIEDLSVTGQDTDSIVFEIIDSIPQMPYSLESDSSVIIPIRFSPMRSGLVAAQLLIHSNDPFREDVSLQLLGTGISPIIILSDTVLNYGLVALSSESQRDIIITNLGTDTLVILDLSITGQHPDSIVYELVSPTLQLPFALEPVLFNRMIH